MGVSSTDLVFNADATRAIVELRKLGDEHTELGRKAKEYGKSAKLGSEEAVESQKKVLVQMYANEQQTKKLRKEIEQLTTVHVSAAEKTKQALASLNAQHATYYGNWNVAGQRSVQVMQNIGKEATRSGTATRMAFGQVGYVMQDIVATAGTMGAAGVIRSVGDNAVFMASQFGAVAGAIAGIGVVAATVFAGLLSKTKAQTDAVEKQAEHTRELLKNYALLKEGEEEGKRKEEEAKAEHGVQAAGGAEAVAAKKVKESSDLIRKSEQTQYGFVPGLTLIGREVGHYFSQYGGLFGGPQDVSREERLKSEHAQNLADLDNARKAAKQARGAADNLKRIRAANQMIAPAEGQLRKTAGELFKQGKTTEEVQSALGEFLPPEMREAGQGKLKDIASQEAREFKARGMAEVAEKASPEYQAKQAAKAAQEAAEDQRAKIREARLNLDEFRNSARAGGLSGKEKREIAAQEKMIIAMERVAEKLNQAAKDSRRNAQD